MNRSSRFALVGIAAVITASASLAFAQATKDPKPAPPKSTPPAKDPSGGAAGDHQLPPGMTEEDMKACIEAGTPGPQHEHLAKGVGVWQGKTKMWMTPEMTEPQTSECTSTITAMMDGRFTKCEIEGDMPGMGPFNGFGLYGFDNVSKKYQSTWIDNCGTGMMNGTGELSSDGRTLTWVFNYNCPITKKPTTMREVERYTGKDTMTLEMYGVDPKSGKEFKMMEIAFTRKPGGAARATPTHDHSKPGHSH
jgi:hypothetical protein